MKTENVISLVIGIAVVGGIGYNLYKKSQRNLVASTEGGPKPNEPAHSASGRPGGIFSPRVNVAPSGLKTASTRSDAFQPGSAPAGKVRWVEGGIVYEGSKDRKTKKAVGEA